MGGLTRGRLHSENALVRMWRLDLRLDIVIEKDDGPSLDESAPHSIHSCPGSNVDIYDCEKCVCIFIMNFNL